MAFFPNSNGGGLPAGNSPLAGVGGVLTPLGMNGGGMDGGGFSPAFATGMHGAFPLALQQPAVRDIQMGNSGENSGTRWSKEEHAQFVTALEEYGVGSTGNEWNLMAQAVGKTEADVKIHAQQYFLKLERERQVTSPPRYNARQSPRTVGFGVRVTGHAGVHEPAGGAVPRKPQTRRWARRRRMSRSTPSSTSSSSSASARLRAPLGTTQGSHLGQLASASA
ncbi:hypothetical protein T484DRAFT_2370005 [Baffinella frigidus]|nr:hypothetical protein T484DRAFT_2370005 [Cryptophyta sp. CCMP2293]